MSLDYFGTSNPDALRGYQVPSATVAGDGSFTSANISGIQAFLATYNKTYLGNSGFTGIGPGQLIVPNRGVLQVLPGDFVAIDPVTGWPVLVSNAAIVGGTWIIND